MITLIGVAHVFDISDRVREEIKKRNPNIVAVELDRQRYEGLKSEERDSGDLPLMYRAMSFIQKKIADKYDVTVGEEMLTATETAKDIGAGIAFIDIPSSVALNKLMNQMSIKEKIYFIFGMIAGLFTGKEKLEKEVESYQENEKDYMDVMEDNMPSVSRVLIDERNSYMAKNILELEEKYGSVISVVGDGHISGLIEELDRDDIDIVRLKELQEEDKGSNAQVEFSYTFNNST